MKKVTDYEILNVVDDGVECSVYASNGDIDTWVWSIDNESGHETFTSASAALADLKIWVREQHVTLSEENISKVVAFSL